MSIPISQSDAAEIFDLLTEVLYVCDGKKECGKPSCSDFSNRAVCHHTSDVSHALYKTHEDFESYPAICNGNAAIIKVEKIRE